MRRLRVVSLSVGLLAVLPTAAEQPNVLVLFVDDLGYRDLSVYGGPVETPALDAQAANGVRFTDFHSGSGVCSPSRAVVMTGRHHIRAGVYHVIKAVTGFRGFFIGRAPSRPDTSNTNPPVWWISCPRSAACSGSIRPPMSISTAPT